MDSNATDTTAHSRFSYDNEKQSLLRLSLDFSPTDSVFPELLKSTRSPTEEEEHTKPSSSPKQREKTVVDPCHHIPPVIPPEHSNRTLVLCFDGTGDQFDADNSNIVQLVSLLKKGDSKQQLVYYQVRFFFPPKGRLFVADVYFLLFSFFLQGWYWHVFN